MPSFFVKRQKVPGFNPYSGDNGFRSRFISGALPVYHVRFSAQDQGGIEPRPGVSIRSEGQTLYRHLVCLHLFSLPLVFLCFVPIIISLSPVPSSPHLVFLHLVSHHPFMLPSSLHLPWSSLPSSVHVVPSSPFSSLCFPFVCLASLFFVLFRSCLHLVYHQSPFHFVSYHPFTLSPFILPCIIVFFVNFSSCFPSFVSLFVLFSIILFFIIRSSCPPSSCRCQCFGCCWVAKLG